MSPSPLNASKRLSTISLVVVTIITIFIFPFSASAMPVVPVEPTSSPGSPGPSPAPSHSRMSHKVIFDIVIGLGLSLLSIGAFACLASWRSFSGFSGVLDRAFFSFFSCGGLGLLTAHFYIRRHMCSLRLSEAIIVGLPFYRILRASRQRHCWRHRHQCLVHAQRGHKCSDHFSCEDAKFWTHFCT
ncbi:hypothetical protein EDB83DRAFT_77816 [Lactarius deliciosus]|nr:hypothetical protein EDB83DRAFT_77816 [Lactarius deliciosus]